MRHGDGRACELLGYRPCRARRVVSRASLVSPRADPGGGCAPALPALSARRIALARTRASRRARARRGGHRRVSAAARSQNGRPDHVPSRFRREARRIHSGPQRVRAHIFLARYPRDGAARARFGGGAGGDGLACRRGPHRRAHRHACVRGRRGRERVRIGEPGGAHGRASRGAAFGGR